MQSTVGPGANLIAGPVNKGVDETLGFVLVLSPEHCEQNFAGRPGDGEIGGAAHHLEQGEQGEHRHAAHRDEARHA